jgi:hypothetical protein
MTDSEKQIIRSTIYTLIELTYSILREKNDLTAENITLLKANENALKELINSLS